MFNKLRKLKGRSAAELRTRSAQALNAHLERWELSAQVRPLGDEKFWGLLDRSRFNHAQLSAISLLEHFRTRRTPRFFASFVDPENARIVLQEKFAGDAERLLLDRAERILEGRFDLLGLKDVSFGSPINWHREPLAQKEAPRVHWSRIDYLNTNVAGDKKIIWELNRHQYFATLGRAYWRTGDERYAQCFISHVSEWMTENPPKMGINWASSLEVAFRSISWLWALHFFKESEHLTPQIFLCMMKFLYLHARHLETYLSTYFSPNTHLTGEALGLFYLGTLLPEFREAKRWRATGERILREALARHVLPDGVYFEQSSYYHRYTTDFYTHFYILKQINGELLEDDLREKLTALLDHLMYITRPDGTTPLFGDDDGGRLMMLDERAANDFRATLSNGAVMFKRGDYKYVAGEASEETFWLMGEQGVEAFAGLDGVPPAHQSCSFPDGGYYVMRDGWMRNANYLLIDCGEYGRLNGAHAHADALSFDLAAKGRTVLVDPGTYTYTGSSEMRDYFRSTAAHNALTVDDESSSVAAGPFGWKQCARSCVRSWVTDERFDFFEGEHDDYIKLNPPVSYIRSVLFLKNDYWIMRDRAETQGAHSYELHFHFAQQAKPRLEEEVNALRDEGSGASSGFDLFSFSGGVDKAVWREEKGLVSSCYGMCVPAPTYALTVDAQSGVEIMTLMIPRAVGSIKPVARETKAISGRAFIVESGETSDVVLIGDGASLIERDGLQSDFEWTWARFEADTKELRELILIKGHRFHFNGQEILDSAEQVDYAVARRIKNEMHIQVNSASQSRILPFEVKPPATGAQSEISNLKSQM